jgi:PfaD family protein
MANGIGSAEIVEAMGRAGMLGIFGAAGLPLAAVDAAIDRLGRTLGPSVPHGFNLIHSPNEPDLEAAVVALYLRRGVRLVEASAYLDLTLLVVRYRVHGIHRHGSGRIVAPNRIIAKVSRVEVASKFLAPPPAKYLRALVASGEITPEQAEWAGRIPMAHDVTAEADSGGHTDNQPAIVLLPTMLALRDRAQAHFGDDQLLRIGAAGGISTPVRRRPPSRWGRHTSSPARSTSRASRRGRPTPCAGCSPRRSRPTSLWPPRPTCSRWGSRSRCLILQRQVDSLISPQVFLC